MLVPRLSSFALALSLIVSQNVVGQAAASPGADQTGDIDIAKLTRSASPHRAVHCSLQMRVFTSQSDVDSNILSDEALQVASILGINDELKRVSATQQHGGQGQKLPSDERADLVDSKFNVLQAIEEARLDVEFVRSELEVEEAGLEEILRSYREETEDRINRANLWGFRTNGILWAVAEALSVPTYKHPRLSISSGTVGIIAGVVPSIFSAYAIRTSGGKMHTRDAHSNMLCKIYGLPVQREVQYPASVWSYFNSPPPDDKTHTRRELLVMHWLENADLKTLANGATKERITALAGAESAKANIQLLEDRMTMLRDVEAAAMQMNRPLLELSMVLSGKKTFPR